MNQTIETVNHWGGRFLEFAWPMLWQSSLLILVVLALDWALARKIRASIRDALWLVVLVKLLLPPTLALPTGVAWWLFPGRHQVAALPKYTVTYSQVTDPVEMPLATVPLPKPPPAQLDRAGWAFIATAAVSTALLGWLLFRWIQVAAMVRRATDAPRFAGDLALAQIRTGLRRRIRLKLVEGRLSPAVCGLFRPVILLPRLLAERLTENQLRAVLLHELIHLRRADIWINCAQALLQILYWWHPFVWLANSRMRRVREEAVDDAVMLALHDDAELYAPTLIEVAKLAFHRPSLSLGLVGIMESRSALRQRIERLMDFRAPRHAGLTLVSALGILAFSAVALPMGSATQSLQSASIDSQANLQTPTIVDPQTGLPVPIPVDPRTGRPVPTLIDPKTGLPVPMPVDPQTGLPVPTSIDPQTGLPVPIPATDQPATNRPQVFITVNLYRMSWADIQKNFSISRLQPAPENNGDNFCWVGSPTEFKRYTDTLKSSGVKSYMAPRVVTLSGILAEFFVGTFTNGFSLDCMPVVTNQQVQLALTATEVETAGRQSITNTFSENVLVPDHGGFLVYPHLWNSPDDSGSKSLVALVKVQILTNGPPSKSVKPVDADQLFTRTFTMDTNFFPILLRQAVDKALSKAPPTEHDIDPGTDVSAMAKILFHLSGVNLASPPGKAVFYNDGKGILLVKATSSDIDIVDRIIQTINNERPQIHLKARFYEIPVGNADKFSRYLVDPKSTGSNITGILTPDNARAVMKALQAVKGAKVLAEPEVLFTSGRRIQMRATQVITVITNVETVLDVTEQTNPMSSVNYETETLETGPIINSTASILADGYTISLEMAASVSDFLGYATPPKGSPLPQTTNSTLHYIDLPRIWPVAISRHGAAKVNLIDNQSLVFSLSSPEVAKFGAPDRVRDDAITREIQTYEEKNGAKEVIVLVTPTIVDSVGNRVHEDYLDIDRQAFPPQPNAVSPPGVFPGRPPGSK